MTWFDLLFVILVLAVVVWEARMETGRALLDTVAVIAAMQFSRLPAAALTDAMNWRPLPGSDMSPLASLISFSILLVLGLVLSKVLHRHARWSMDQFDLLFGAALGLVMAVALGHQVADITARFVIERHGFLPDYYQNSLVADELRSFRTYHYVVAVFHTYQNGRAIP